MDEIIEIKIWVLYDSEGKWCGYYPEDDKWLADLWAKSNNGTVKLEIRQYGNYLS